MPSLRRESEKVSSPPVGKPLLFEKRKWFARRPLFLTLIREFFPSRTVLLSLLQGGQTCQGLHLGTGVKFHLHFSTDLWEQSRVRPLIQCAR